MGADYRLPAVPIFAAGDFDGEAWTEADLDEIAANFQRLSTGPRPLLEPPAVVGHEEDQQLLERTDLPAGGWIRRLWKARDDEDGIVKLWADIEQIPAEVAGWINDGLYRKVSAEIYDDPSQGNLPGEGKVLRRVALLGGEIPRQKHLGALPFAVTAGSDGASLPAPPPRLRFCEATQVGNFRRISFFAERGAVAAEDDKFERCVKHVKEAGTAVNPWAVCHATLGSEASCPQCSPFAESIMDREQLTQAALQLGLTQATVDLLDDAALASVVLELQARAAGQPAPGEAPPEMPVMAETPEEEEERKRREAAAAMSEGGTGAPPPPAPAPAAPFAAPAHPQQVVLKYNELERRYRRLERRLDESERRRAERDRAEHADTVRSFCERMLRDKKVLPAEIDPQARTPNLFHRLLRADCARKVHTFGERRGLSEYQLQCAEVEARDPAALVRFFSEKVPSGGVGAGGGAPNAPAVLSQERRQQLLGSSPLGTAILRTQKNGR
jgi:hypothetical protein